MKKLLFLLVVILIHGNIALASSNNLLSRDWWKTATFEDVKKELKNGADVNVKNKNGATALMWAAKFSQNPKVIEVLIDEGADVNAKDNDGFTALMLASGFQKTDTVKALLKAGADVNAKNKDGATALMSAAMFQKTDTVKALLKAGADVNAKDNDGTTVLMLATKFSQNPKVIEVLIDEGADVNAKNKNGATALMLAAMGQKTDTIKALLKAGADVNVIANDGNITAVSAALNKNPEVHSLILQAMDTEGYCKLTKNNSFYIGLCIDEMNVYAQKEYMLPDCTHNMPAMLYLSPLMNAFFNNTPNERKIIGWLTLAESAKRFNCSLGKTMYITIGGEDFNKKMEKERKELSIKRN